MIKDGLWECTVQSKYISAKTGNHKRIKRRAPTEDEARQRALMELNRDYINDETGDLQKIDVGIALYHFAAGLEEAGQKPEIVCDDPGIAVQEGVEYVAGVSVY